ncbi:MAG: TIGR00295 family protein [Candidatus Bathyarchaeota archaeon]
MEQIITSDEAISILYRVGCSTAVIKHCKAVSNLAVKLAHRLEKKGVEVDVDLVRIGGLFHDIGRSQTHDIKHAIVGAEIMRSLHMSNSVIRIVERHIGSGIPANEAVKLGLPNKDFIPETREEKIVSYADKLIEGNHKISFDAALQRFSDEFGNSHTILTRFKQIHKELGE